MHMNGYRLSDKDVEAMIRWLKVHHLENANQDFAAAMLVDMKLTYRQTGWDDPDKLEDFYIEYVRKLSDQNGKMSDE
jgi:hypothetical protein